MGKTLEPILVSPDYEIVIPAAVTKTLNVRPEQRLQVVPYQGRIELVPIGPAQAARGFLRGIDTDVDRDDDRQ